MEIFYSILLILLASLIFPGTITRVKSRCSGRKGPSIFQPLHDATRLFRKGEVISTTTGPVFRIAPAVYLASIIMAAATVPFGEHGALLSFNGDFVFFAYTLALGKFFSIIGALDTGSSFEGMGASRESLYSMLAEPAFFLTIGSLALLTGYTSFADIFSELSLDGVMSYMYAIIAAAILLLLAMVESSRLPIDDPKTHLELTMIHEVMILDNSGPSLGMIFVAGYLKFAIYGALVADLFIGNLPLWYSIPLFFGIQLLCASIIGLVESFFARSRMNHNPQFIFAMSSVAMLLIFGVLIIAGKI